MMNKSGQGGIADTLTQTAGFFAHSPKKNIWVKSVYSIDIQIDNGEIRVRGG